ncbi:SNF2 domain-containing protein [Modicisalibacter xianhensis]|uniref:SNF2 domain-containing protein n=1 Tax=Modicisalibacter xianhensis TaxID=442341 RepID=A0A4V3GS65_9GAMM|nr:DEAD/DEAH box helicase [Halomonas xianhensis]TDX21643.1 SNF2 domain-containing protein [Halomonas xianhensis]
MATDFTPHAYQKRAAKFIVRRKRCMLALSPGLGKTSSTLLAEAVLRKHGHVRKTLVIAPLRPAQMVWAQEARKWKQFEHLKITLLHGPKKAERLREEADIYVVNVEGLQWLIKEAGDTCPFDMIVLDESTLLKSPSSKRAKALRPWARQVEYFVELTGTPTPHSLEDLFGQIYLLDGGESLGKYITHFRSRYFRPVSQRGHVVYKWGLLPGADELIYERISHLCLRMSAEEYLDLPDILYHDVTVRLTSKVMKQYKSLEREMFAELDEGLTGESATQLLAMSAASARQQCHQFTGGAVYHEEDKSQWHVVHDEKEKALVELLESLQGAPVLVAIQFRHELPRVKAAIKKVTGIDPPAIVGGQKLDLDQLQGDWNCGRHPALIVHPASLSHGANLQGAGIGVIWYSLSDNFEHYEQLNRRLHRQGRKEPVHIWHLIAENTVDKAIRAASAEGGEKDSQQSRLLSALLKYRDSVLSI